MIGGTDDTRWTGHVWHQLGTIPVRHQRLTRCSYAWIAEATDVHIDVGMVRREIQAALVGGQRLLVREEGSATRHVERGRPRLHRIAQACARLSLRYLVCAARSAAHRLPALPRDERGHAQSGNGVRPPPAEPRVEAEARNKNGREPGANFRRA